ncbi:hypothetical protein HVPorG_05059 (plasmid) [Roseomonas mucosa]|uniref:hypothetical protein n=1 Tax=Roseomonas mucosa TaxID=207340 RepID=UPI002204C5C0|nr:hypothetical protein [Roseomonas mucosa]QDJ12259.1 hypothetical protein HVPorG_05059 [Roseomonas mucosa]
MKKRTRDGYDLQDLKADLGALVGLIAFLTIILSVVVLPVLLTDSASTVSPRLVRDAHR